MSGLQHVTQTCFFEDETWCGEGETVKRDPYETENQHRWSHKLTFLGHGAGFLSSLFVALLLDPFLVSKIELLSP